MNYSSMQNSMILEDDTLLPDDLWGQEDLELALLQDQDFSRQTTMETVQSAFSRQTSMEMGNAAFSRQITPHVGYVPTFEPLQRPTVEIRTSHSPSGSSQDSTQDSDGQRVIRLMEHLMEPLKPESERCNYNYNYDDGVNTDDEITDVNDITKCLFDEGSNKDNFENCAGDEVRKFGESGYNNMPYGFVSPKALNGGGLGYSFEGRPDMNCAIQNTFLHFSPDVRETQPMRRSNSLGALPLRGL